MKRPHIPLSVKLEAAIRQLGLDPATAELDHDPALELRERIYVTSIVSANVMLMSDKVGSYYTIPDANDPKYLVWRSKEAHTTKTNGPGGTKRITTRGGDHGDAAHLRAVTKKEAEFRQRLLAKFCTVSSGEAVEFPPIRKRKIPSRPFPKRRK